ncbi:MAG TPA: hypothetical protein VMR80_10530 [Candidatus Acidoferrum sp.]|nr:hypothetical protein [Candidatus Acidoferrum sp.]
MKSAKDCPATSADIFDLGVRLLAAWMVIQNPGTSLDDALLKASDVFVEVSKRHGYLLENLPRAESEAELLAALSPSSKRKAN